MDKLFDIRHWGTAGRELSRESFILYAIQHRDFRVKTVEYTIFHNANEEFVVRINGEDEEIYYSMAELVDALGKLYDISISWTLEEIRYELLSKEDQCDRVQLVNLMSTIGYINCQIVHGYEPTDKEMTEYVNILLSMGL